MKKSNMFNKLMVTFVVIFLIFTASSVHADYENALPKKIVYMGFSPLLDANAFNITEINVYNYNVGTQQTWDVWWGPYVTTYANGWQGNYTTTQGVFHDNDWVRTGADTTRITWTGTSKVQYKSVQGCGGSSACWVGGYWDIWLFQTPKQGAPPDKGLYFGEWSVTVDGAPLIATEWVSYWGVSKVKQYDVWQIFVGSCEAEVCDGWDNDCDDLTDEDFTWKEPEGLAHGNCSDGLDNDCDGLTNGNDPGCSCTCCPEECNGIDDDCDGSTDEDQGYSTCGDGGCLRTVYSCEGGAPQYCQPGQPSSEICSNSIDDDCDSFVDESGTAGGCYGTCIAEVCNDLDDDCDGSTDEGFGRTTCGVGACEDSVDDCSGGFPQFCKPGAPTSECWYDGIDNDCDGSTDEGSTCPHPPLEICDGIDNDMDGSTDEGFTITSEVCNGDDDDCDGFTDEGMTITTCGTGGCEATVPCGTCTPGAPGIEVCGNNIDDDCDGSTDEGGTEACDGADNDCDGSTDEGMTVTTCGTGECENTVLCGSCTEGSPTGETCDGLDNDCDGSTDEGMSGASECPGGGPDGIDNDCNGQTDEVCVCCSSVIVEYDFQDSNYVVDYEDPNLTASDLTVTSNSPELQIGFKSAGFPGNDDPAFNVKDDWLTENEIAYVEFDVAVDAGYQMMIKAYDFRYARDNPASPNSYDVKYSTDDVIFTSIGSGSMTDDDVWYSASQDNGGTPLTSLRDTVYFHLEVNPSGEDGKRVYFDNIQLIGQVSPCPAETSGAVCSDGIDNDCDGSTDECACCCTSSSEVCNGMDDDCDGSTDEGLDVPSTCGIGACEVTVLECSGGSSQTCMPGFPSQEVCANFIDDDCDGSTDEPACGTCGTEICDGIDNDCDGSTDEGLPESEAICDGMDDNCNGSTDECVCAETCNGIDDDCDGSTDNGLGVATCGTGECEVTVGNCSLGSPQTCYADAPSSEICDGLDNDCDGSTDEGLGRTTCGTGGCENAADNCSGGSSQTCVPGAPVSEACEACFDGIDNDCDGSTDECMCAPTAEICNGLDDDVDCSTDEGLGQTTCGVGDCVHAEDNCVGGSPNTCDPMAGAGVEVCGGGDEDCDGSTDEGLGSATCGTGACEATVANCSGGSLQTCMPGTPVSEVAANSIDDDCDGSTDEGAPPCSPGDPVVERCGNSLDDDCDGYLDESGTQGGCADESPPPGGYCESDFNCDDAVDANDTPVFTADYGRWAFSNPCTEGDPCVADYNCDNAVDANDTPVFAADYGRWAFSDPCPACVPGVWCDYP